MNHPSTIDQRVEKFTQIWSPMPMDINLVEKIFKSAILLEIKGKSFYTKIAADAENNAVKEFFKMMAEDEAKHIQILSDQYKSSRSKVINPDEIFTDTAITDVSAFVFNNRLNEKITAAGFEAAAISAAILMEKNAIELYSQQITKASDGNAKKLYAWLTKWESEHLNALSEIDRKLTEAIWMDNRFWPF